MHLGQGVCCSRRMLPGCLSFEHKEFSFRQLYIGRKCKLFQADSGASFGLFWIKQQILICNFCMKFDEMFSFHQTYVKGQRAFCVICTRENSHRKDPDVYSKLHQSAGVFNYRLRHLLFYLIFLQAAHLLF